MLPQNIDERNCTIGLEGRTFTANGAYVDDDRAFVYLDGSGTVTTWNGEDIGSYWVVSTWKCYGSLLGSFTMQAVRICLKDGRRYYGRLNADWSQLVKARRVRS